MVHQFTYKLKSVKSGNPFKFVIQTINDIIKAHGGEIKWKRGRVKEVSLLLVAPLSESQIKKIK